MTEMQVRAGRIDSKFNAERTAERELLTEFRFADDLRATLLKKGKSFSRLHERNSATSAGAVLFVFV